MGSMVSCIWRKGCDRIVSLEHIIPEGLGCPAELVFKNGEVCKAHNNDLGHLDQAVIDQFDVFLFRNKVPRKRGKPPQINSRGNMVGFWDGEHPVILLNTDRRSVSIQGKQVGGFGGSKRNVQAAVHREGDIGEVSFRFTLGDSPKFVRGIVKIAFSSLAYFIGSENVLTDRFDPIRDFVLQGSGDRRIIWWPVDDENYRHEVWGPSNNEAGDFLMHFRLVCFEFVVDLSPEMTLFPIFKDTLEKQYGREGWGYLPL